MERLDLKFSDKARTKIREFMEGSEDQENLAIRVGIAGQGPSGFEYEFFLDVKQNARPNDLIVHLEDLTALVAAEHAPFLNGATVDWRETVGGAGFDVDNPNTPPPQPDVPEPDLDSPLAKKVQEVIDTRINPGVASHGGFVELIDVQGDKAFVRLGGGCQGCGMVNVTLKQGIEVMIKEQVPEISEIIDTTDHAGGSNPYYQPSK